MKFFHLNCAIVLCLCIVTPTEQALDNGLRTFVATLAGSYKNATVSRMTDIIFYYRQMPLTLNHPDSYIWLVMMEYNGTQRERMSFVRTSKGVTSYHLHFYILKNEPGVLEKWGGNPNWKTLGDLHYDNLTAIPRCKRTIYMGESGVYKGTWPQWPECISASNAPAFRITVNCKEVVIKTEDFGDFPYQKQFINYPPNEGLAPSGHPCET